MEVGDTITIDGGGIFLLCFGGICVLFLIVAIRKCYEWLVDDD